MGEFRLSTLQLATVTRQLATMVSVGVPLQRGLQCCAQGGDEKVAVVMSGLATMLSAGNYLSRCLSRYPEAFPPFYIGVVEAGEGSGSLSTALERLADLLERQAALRAKIIAALTYPAVVASFSLLGASCFVFFLFPGLQPLYAGLGLTLPWPTRLLLAMRWLGPLSVALGAAVIWYLRHYSQWTLEDMLEVTPILGRLLRVFREVQVLRSLSLLLDAGLTFSEAMFTAARSSGSRRVAESLERTVVLVSRGESLETALAASAFFSTAAISMLLVGQETVGLAFGASRACVLLEQEVETAVATLASVLEPIATLVVGGVVGLIVTGSLLPTIKMLQTL